MDLDFAVLADGVAQRPDGKLDIFGAGFDTLLAASVPAQHPRLVLAVRVLLSLAELEHTHALDVVLQTSDGNDLAQAQAKVSALPEQMREGLVPERQFGLGMVLNFNDVVFPEYGGYQLAIRWDGTEARPPLRLRVAERQPE